MKNLCITIILCGLGYISCSAQRIGLQGGLNFTNVTSDTDVDLSSSNGLHIGLAADIPLVWPYEIGTGVFYTRRGYKSEEQGREGTVSIDYIDIPVNLRFRLQLADLIGAFVSVGPYFSYGVNSKVFDSNGVLTNGYSRDDIDLNRIDSGMNVGAGVDLTNVRVSAAYGLSFTDLGVEPGNRLKNRDLKISVGYFFQ